MEIIFYITSGIALLATLMVITRLNAVHALLYLTVSLLSIGLIFFIMGAPFAAALEVIIYAGAIMVLFIFVIMMLNLGMEAVKSERKLLSARVWIGPSVLVLILGAEFIYILYLRNGQPHTPAVVSAKQVGISLFSAYMLGVEMAGLLLIAGIIGAYHLGYTGRRNYHRFLKGGPE
jgi:NADH-quinone oxidoreductase subunit J